MFHLLKNPVKPANTSFVTSYSTNPNPVHCTRWTRDDFPPKRPGLMGKFWLQKDIFMITAIRGQTQTSFYGTSFYVTICDYMWHDASCRFMWLYVNRSFCGLYIYIYTHSTLTWLYVSVKLAILQFTWQYITVQRLLPWIMSRVHIDEFGNGLLCRVWGANHLGPERLCKWHVASPHVDILGIWQGYVYIYIYICMQYACIYMYIYIYIIFIYIYNNYICMYVHHV